MSTIIDVTKKITEKGYWKITIRPIPYKKERVQLNDFEAFLRENQVRLRGWPYPHIDHENGIERNSKDSISSSCIWDAGSMYEFWSLYDSGQFIHSFIIREDWKLPEDEILNSQQSYGTKSQKYLSILSTLYTITEIFTFSSRYINFFEDIDSIEVNIELVGVKDRTLMFYNHLRSLYRAYTCTFEEDKISITHRYSLSEIASKYKEFALDVTDELLSCFQFDYTRSIMEEEQKKFFERRI